MTARHDPHDPLTPDERALAALLDASSAGPSPSLDARILAAARAAAAQPATLPHAPATSVPAAAIDAERRRRHQRPRGLRWARVGGVAASLVVVLGLGWRLALEAPMQHEAAADMEAAASANDDAAVMVQAIKPPPSSVQIAPDLVVEPPSAQPAPASDAAAQASAADAQLREAAPPPRRVAEPVARKAMAQSAPAPDAMADMAPAAAPVATPPPPPAAPPAAVRSDDRARAEERRSRPAANAAASSGSAAAAESESLDRIQVTGSRIRMGDVGISEDARLPIADWLDRIRSRRDAGDLDGARGSLARFRAQHPRVAIPDDLVALDVAPR